MVKNPSEMQETWVQSLGWEDPLEEGMATHALGCLESNLPGKYSCLENPHGQSARVHKG